MGGRLRLAALSTFSSGQELGDGLPRLAPRKESSPIIKQIIDHATCIRFRRNEP